MNIYTIGFTQKRASTFFGLLAETNVSSVLDVRINNRSQLSGFARQEDLAFFLWQLNGIGYSHEKLLAPPKELLARYRASEIGWEHYAEQFCQLLHERRVADRIEPERLEGACLLCSEHEPHYCHRRLVLDYLASEWRIEMKVRHLK